MVVAEDCEWLDTESGWTCDNPECVCYDKACAYWEWPIGCDNWEEKSDWIREYSKPEPGWAYR